MNYKNAFKHFKTILTHKYWVGYYCFCAGLYWQGIIHDLSKFSPTEFLRAVKYYQGNSSPIDAEKKATGGYSEAWLHHRGRNPHHYEYWTDNFDSGTTSFPMPYKYALEMVCDYLGAGRAYSKKAFTYDGEYKWWMNQITIRTAMHPKTKRFVTLMMYIFSKYDGIDILKDRNQMNIIQSCYDIGGDMPDKLWADWVIHALQKLEASTN